MVTAEKYFDGKVPATLAELLSARAARNTSLPAATFIDDAGQRQTLSYAELLEEATRVADLLRQIGPAGCRALMLYPAGLDFLISFFGCSLAGWIPVPTCYPKAGRPIQRLDSIARTCSASVLLSDKQTLDAAATEKWCQEAASIPHIATDILRTEQADTLLDSVSTMRRINTETNLHPELALLQFTSGSTNEPKGVMVSHENMLANLEAIRVGFELPFSDNQNPNGLSAVFWLPAFHDMGLIGGMLAPLYSGVHTVLMSPNSFLRRPLTWLKAISDYKAYVTGAPNFAYQLCVERIDGAQADGLDLSHLALVFCGSEPIQARTLEQFASRFAHTGLKRSALFPCYGLAESTLYVSGGHFEGEHASLSLDRADLAQGKVKLVDPRTTHSDATSRVVSCGQIAIDSQVRIVDAETNTVLPEKMVGQIWIRGRSVAAGYWTAPDNAGSADVSEKSDINFAFQNRLNDDDEGLPYLHTGDLGFLFDDKLYITGRTKDVIILRGRNHYPQDIEFSISREVGSAVGQAVAVSCSVPGGEGLAVVVELDRSAAEDEIPNLIRQIRRIVIEQHEVDPRRITLVRAASIPRTTSGKVQRSVVKQMLQVGELKVKGSWDRTDVRADGVPLPFPELDPSMAAQDSITYADSLAISIESWLVSWLMVRGGVEQQGVCGDRSLDQLGLDSLSAVELSGEIEDWLGLQLTPVVAFEYPTPRKLATYLAKQWVETKISI